MKHYLAHTVLAASLLMSIVLPANAQISYGSGSTQLARTQVLTNNDPDILSKNPPNEPQSMRAAASAALVPGYPADINAIAAACQYDPKKLYDFVHNNIKFQPYYGFRKGATLTWLTRSGNAEDQDTLLGQLLGASGYSSWFQQIDFTVPLAEAEAWFGVSNATALNQITASAGYAAYVDSANQVLKIRMFNLVALIDGSYYRMFPAFKTNTTVSGINLASALGYSHSDLMTAAGGTTTDISVQGVSESGVSSYIGGAAMNLVNQIKTSYPNSTVNDIVGGQRITQAEVTDLNQCFPVFVRDLQSVLLLFLAPMELLRPANNRVWTGRQCLKLCMEYHRQSIWQRASDIDDVRARRACADLAG